MRPTRTAYHTGAWLIFLALLLLGISYAQLVPEITSFGPYNGVFRPGGNGLSKPLEPTDAVLQATSPRSLFCWFQSQEGEGGSFLLAGVGNPLAEYARYFGIRDGKLIFWMGEDNRLTTTAALPAAEWHFVAAPFDGVVVPLYSDGQEVARGKLALGRVSPNIQMAPEELPWKGAKHCGGRIVALTLLRTTLNAAEIRQLYAQAPNPALSVFAEGSKPWPIQARAQAGYRAPQNPASWPRNAAPFSPPAARRLLPSRTSLQPRADNPWALEGGWKLTPVSADSSCIFE